VTITTSKDTSSSPAVETIGVAKRYPSGVEALAGIDLRIEQGEIFALLGPNGAGKTTWISIVCGLARATAGSARVLGLDVVKDALAARRVVGLVPQEINFDPFFKVREVLRFQQGYFGVRRDDARIDEILAALDLTAKADAGTRELSGGMKRRLLIAKALVHSPRVVFLDEPTAGVDVNLRRDLWDYVRELRRRGTTIVLTTHYLEEAEALADRVGVIDQGKLLVLDTPGALLARHGARRIKIKLASPLTVLPAELAALGATLDPGGLELSCPVASPGMSAPPANGQPAPAEIRRVISAVAALDASIAVTDLRTEQPTLEQVFIALVGHRKGAAA
jgi:ABC-2 type transport system ATP-binding protein